MSQLFCKTSEQSIPKKVSISSNLFCERSKQSSKNVSISSNLFCKISKKKKKLENRSANRTLSKSSCITYNHTIKLTAVNECMKKIAAVINCDDYNPRKTKIWWKNRNNYWRQMKKFSNYAEFVFVNQSCKLHIYCIKENRRN